MIEHPKAGQIVTHVAGSFRMTVQSHEHAGVFCRWFRDGALCTGCFVPAVLKELEQPAAFAALPEPGAVVQLRTGGPLMAITSIANGVADCEWFDREGDRQDCRFAIAELQPFVLSRDPQELRDACRGSRGT